MVYMPQLSEQDTVQNLLKMRNWQHYLTRPFTIFGASLWQEWYASDQMKQCLGITCPDALFFEESKGVARCYRPFEQVQTLNSAAHRLVFDAKHAVSMFRKGLELNEKAKSILERTAQGKREFRSVPDAVAFLTELSLKATVLPNRVGAFLDVHESPPKQVVELMEQLRSVSYYPRIIEEIVLPLAREHLLRAGVQDIGVLDVVTYTEFRDGIFAEAKARLAAQQRGEFYWYAILNGKETVSFVQDIRKAISQVEPEHEEKEVHGQIACAGKAIGKVRIVNTGILKDVPFDTGDILVSVSTTPLYLPLMKKAGAIVVDEGGLASHAAILARELQKPCIIGTGNATRVLKEGDVVEVDAEKGVVRKVR